MRLALGCRSVCDAATSIGAEDGASRSRRKPQWMGQTKEVARCQEEVLEEVLEEIEVVGIRERRRVDIIQ